MASVISTVFVTLVDTTGYELAKFYRDLFGVEPKIWIPQVYAEFELPGLRLGIFKPKAEREAEFQGQGGMSLCIEVTNLEEGMEQLTQLGCPPPGPIITASHGREIYAYDPAGNRLILHQKVE